jgi:hypothetical protein
MVLGPWSCQWRDSNADGVAAAVVCQVFLHIQDRILARKGTSTWSKDYYMPVTSDSAIIASKPQNDNS